MRISVTAKHIQKAKAIRKAFYSRVRMSYCAGEECPVALALSDAFGQRSFVSNKWTAIGGTHLTTPEVVYDFIKKYDQRIEVEPFEFDINLDEENHA